MFFLCLRKKEHYNKNSAPIEVTEEGIDIWDNDEQPLKVKLAIVVIEEGIDICINDEHLAKRRWN